MMDCTNCNRKVEYPPVPFVVHENMRAQMDLQIRRLIRVIVLLVVLLVGSNMAWLFYEEQFETVRVQQENDRGINNFIGNDGDINNGNPDNYLP
jgi:hypothetical protein